MALVAAAVGGGALVWRASHGNHSRYSDHSKHSEYGDASVRAEIERQEREVNRKESDVANLRQRMNDNFNLRINELKREKNYSGLDAASKEMVAAVKEDMRRELDAEISRDKQELAEIDKMIARINELELQSRQRE